MPALGGFRAALGARVIACASPSKQDIARIVGGALCCRLGWQKEVLKTTGGRGVDVIRPVGRIKDALTVWGGSGFAGGEIEKFPPNLVLFKNVSIIENTPERVDELFTSGRLKPVVYYTLETLTQGMQDLENRKRRGKL